MHLLLKKNKNIDNKFAGAYVPQQIYNYLSLYSLSCGFSKSNVIRAMMQDWYDSSVLEFPEKQLIAVIIDELTESWKLRKRAIKDNIERDNVYSIFIKEVKILLRSKGISNEVISSIISKIK